MYIAVVKTITSVCLFLIVTASLPLQGGEAHLTFCDLVRNPTKYNGHEVTVRASYNYGFEWQELYCLDCLELGRAWLEIPENLDAASEKALKRMPKAAGIVNLTVRGVFYSGGHDYFHYRYKFVATEISDVVVVVKGERVSDKKKAAERRLACGGSDPR
jgi:hypothetical protein